MSVCARPNKLELEMLESLQQKNKKKKKERKKTEILTLIQEEVLDLYSILQEIRKRRELFLQHRSLSYAEHSSFFMNLSPPPSPVFVLFSR